MYIFPLSAHYYKRKKNIVKNVSCGQMEEITIRLRGILTENLPCDVHIRVPKTLIFDQCMFSEDVPL